MATKLINTCLVFFCLLIAACGPSAEEIKAHQKHIDDSTHYANEQREIKRAQITEAIKGYESNLTELNANLEVEKDKLNEIKGFQLLRTKEEREQQIYDQEKVILNYQETIKSVAAAKDSLTGVLRGL